MPAPRVKSALTLLVRIDPHSVEGLQQQVYSGIRQAILSGALQPGARLPSSRALASDLSISRTTALLAYEQLRAEGYLAARRGSGSFVAAEIPDDLVRVRVLQPVSASRHPPLSRRGRILASLPPAARRVSGPPRPFRIGVPALDLFPVHLWAQLAGRRLRSVTAPQLDYGEMAGLRALRETIADHVRTARGARCHADHVVVVAGAQRGIDFIASLLLDPDDRAWMEEPGYPGVRRALLRAGARIVPVHVDEEGLDVEAGARQAPHARLAAVSPSHQFPLGVPMSLPRRLALLRWARAARAWVIEDDYDSEFRYGARPIPCLQGLDVDDRVIYVGTFSKTLFPSIRLGFLIVPPDLTDSVVAARRAGDTHPPLLDQTVLADFMAAGHYERHLRRMRAAYRERLEAVIDAAKRHCAGALWIRPTHTGLHLVADVVPADADRVFEEALARGVEVMPLSNYAMNRAETPNALILGFGSVRPDGVNAGMERLAAAIEAALVPVARRGAD